MQNKLTKTEIMNEMLVLNEIKSNPIYVEFLKHEIDLIAKKNANRGESKTKKENAEFSVKVLNKMCDGLKGTATQIGNAFGVTSQKITPILKTLVESGQVEKFKIDSKTNGYRAIV